MLHSLSARPGLALAGEMVAGFRPQLIAIIVTSQLLQQRSVIVIITEPGCITPVQLAASSSQPPTDTVKPTPQKILENYRGLVLERKARLSWVFKAWFFHQTQEKIPLEHFQ